MQKVFNYLRRKLKLLLIMRHCFFTYFKILAYEYWSVMFLMINKTAKLLHLGFPSLPSTNWNNIFPTKKKFPKTKLNFSLINKKRRKKFHFLL